MIIEKLSDTDVRVTPENELDEAFWEETKRLMKSYESLEKSLRKENKHLRQELNYARKQLSLECGDPYYLMEVNDYANT